MLKKTITYEDFNGNERTEDFYFHFTEAELTEMNLSHDGGMEVYINRIINTQDVPSLIVLFKELVLKAYGVKSDDGKRFIKTDEVREAFAQTNAYSQLFMELVSDEEAAALFISECVPKKVSSTAKNNTKALPLNS